MIIVTGGAGFIGCNLVRGLNGAGEKDILVVDDLIDGSKFHNLNDCQISDYWDITELDQFLDQRRTFTIKPTALFHQGACTVTTERDGRYMMQNNFTFSKRLLHYCLDNHIPFIYASSGSVYGTGRSFGETVENESPVNVYGYSKYLFDMYVRKNALNASGRSQVTGLRYFNVYGPHEQHKKSMASVIFHFNEQLHASGCIRLFRGSGGYADGEQRRDFVHVDDVISANLWFLQNSAVSGIFNIGTGISRSFNDVAHEVIRWHGRGQIEYIDFPQELRDGYQSFTEADLGALRAAGCRQEFTPLETGVTRYLEWLNAGRGNINKEN